MHGALPWGIAINVNRNPKCQQSAHLLLNFYTFGDLRAVIRVKPASTQDARAKYSKHVDCAAQRSMLWRRIASHRTAPHRIASHRIASHSMALHRIASHRIASHRIALHSVAQHSVA